MSLFLPSRRTIVTGAALGGAAALAGCDQLSRAPAFNTFLNTGEALSHSAQRFLLSDQPLAREFSERDRSPTFRTNGSATVSDPAYNAMAARGFADYRLEVSGLVERPLRLSLADIKAMPARSQITRHDCVEGWSAIGKWTGAPLAGVLQMAGLKPGARFIVFHCADNLGGPGAAGRYYESIDLFDAFHPQTILAYAINDEVLPIGHGAPLRLRVERQLGYKQAKFVMGVEAAARLDGFGRGRGGFWEDRGYQWYAGI